MTQPGSDGSSGVESPFPRRAARHSQENSQPVGPSGAADGGPQGAPAAQEARGVAWTSPSTVAAANGVQSDGVSTGGGEVASAVASTASTKRKPFWKKAVLGFFLVFLLGIIGFAGIFLYAYNRATVPPPSDFALAQTTVVYYDDGETEMGRFSEVNRTVIDIEDLPPYVTAAVIASEDRTFYTNAGVDLKGIARAAVNNLRGGARQGASTLSQQYVENYYLGAKDKTYFDKMDEALIALKINRSQSKEEILSNYMNTIYFGRNTYGIEAAAQAYFGVDAEALTLSEAALLAGIIPAPSIWDPAEDPEMAHERWQRVLDLMVEDEWITAEMAAEQTFPETIPPGQSVEVLSGWEGYLLEQVRTELVSTGSFTEEEIGTGGLKVVSTIDHSLQLAAVEAVNVMPEDTPASVQVALSSIDNATGEIVAEYAGGDYQRRQINAVTQESAQAGSVLKPFALIPYVEDGGSLYTTFDANSPQTFHDITVQNVSNTSYGQINLIQATKVSANTAFVALNEDIGPKTFMDTVIEAGIPEDTPGLEANLTNVLGSAAVHNIDISHAYSTLANGGEKVTPHIVREVLDSNDNVVYEASVAKERVFPVEVVSTIFPALEAPMEVGGTADRVAVFGRAMGGKTGTSEESKSAQFVGFVPQMTTAVSMYNVGEDGEELSLPSLGWVSGFHGGDWPVDVWMAYMQKAFDGLEDIPFSWYDSSSIQQPEPEPVAPVTPEPAPEPEPEPETEPEVPEDEGGPEEELPEEPDPGPSDGGDDGGGDGA